MDEDRHETNIQAGTQLSREQKAGFGFVIVCGLLALVFGGQYLWTHMASPFVISYTGPRFVTGSEAELAQLAEQKKLDTDTDTINDYDELYIYKTSPYLADTDSDGLTDEVEVMAGEDPNCIKGKVCAPIDNEDVLPESNSASLDAQAADLAAKQAALEQAFNDLSSLPVADVRGMLIDSGADAERVEALTDDQVLELYQSVLQQVSQADSIQEIVQPDLAPQP